MWSRRSPHLSGAAVVRARPAEPPAHARPRTAKALPSYGYLHDLMRRYQVRHLVNLDRETFVKRLEAFATLDDHAMEGFAEPGKQHPNAVRFHWGHRHDFGEFSMPGRMGNHHIAVVTTFIDELRAIPRTLGGWRVLDIGCWTGGTSLLLCAMGAEVVAVEEVKKYADCARFLARAFDVPGLEVRHTSLYECTGDDLQDAFDLVLFPGVLHHLSDPRLALRITFNCLRDGGQCLVETLSYDHDRRILERRAEERRARQAGASAAASPWGWHWLLFTPPTLVRMLEDVGFTVEQPPTVVDGRLFAVARRRRHVDLLRAGLSVRNIR